MHHMTTAALVFTAIVTAGCSKGGDEAASVDAPVARPAQRASVPTTSPAVTKSAERLEFESATARSLHDLSNKITFIERIATFQKDDTLIRDSRFLGREIDAAKKQLAVMENAPDSEVPRRKEEIQDVLANLTERVATQMNAAESIKPEKPARLPSLDDVPTTAPAVPK